MFALVDADSFYCSAERLMRPSLRGVPLVVLSNNAGCAVARTEEAKALGVRMGQPYHEFRYLEEAAGLVALSPNFPFYAEISDRIASITAGLGPESEVYSIDETFCGMHGVRGDLRARGIAVRERILQWVGVPCGVGFGPTKTLAKLANRVAKQAHRKPGSYPPHHALVCDLTVVDRGHLDQLLEATAVGDVWGVGPRISAQLIDAGIHNALALARMDPSVVRARWSVMLERTVRELQGTPCFTLETAPPPRQQIAVTRSFGAPVTEMRPLIEAVTEFATRACTKLRKQGSYAAQVIVFVRTSPFRKTAQYSRSVVIPLVSPTADTHAIVRAAVQGLRAIYAPGYDLAKAGVLLIDLRSPEHEQLSLLPSEAKVDSDPTRDRLMQAVDSINDRFGRGAVKLGSAGVGTQPRAWMQRQKGCTPAYTTDWSCLPIVRA